MCQRGGGHLASITSKKEDEMIQVARKGFKRLWVGGKEDEDGELRWSDKSTWDYARWSPSRKNIFFDRCVLSTESGLDNEYCNNKNGFICQVEFSLLKGNTTVTKVNSEVQTVFGNFYIWYKFLAVSQQLLDGWKNKRMTGFRVSWRITNPTVMWTSSISEIGRSIKTPGFNESSAQLSHFSSDHVYSTSLFFPKNSETDIGNDSLIIELSVDMNKEDELSYKNYKLYYGYKTWSEANAFCIEEGGQLASVHSEYEQKLAEKAADGKEVWLGGQMLKRRSGDGLITQPGTSPTGDLKLHNIMTGILDIMDI